MDTRGFAPVRALPNKTSVLAVHIAVQDFLHPEEAFGCTEALKTSPSVKRRTAQGGSLGRPLPPDCSWGHF